MGKEAVFPKKRYYAGKVNQGVVANLCSLFTPNIQRAVARVQVVSGGNPYNQTLKAADNLRGFIVPLPFLSAVSKFIQHAAAGVQLVGSRQTANGMNSPKNTKKDMKKSINQKNQSLNTYLHSVSVIFQRVAAGVRPVGSFYKNEYHFKNAFSPDSSRINSIPKTNPVLLFIPNSPKTILKSFRV